MYVAAFDPAPGPKRIYRTAGRVVAETVRRRQFRTTKRLPNELLPSIISRLQVQLPARARQKSKGETGENKNFAHPVILQSAFGLSPPKNVPKTFSPCSRADFPPRMPEVRPFPASQSRLECSRQSVALSPLKHVKIPLNKMWKFFNSTNEI